MATVPRITAPPVPTPQDGRFSWRQPVTLPLGWAVELRCPAVTSCGPGLGKARGASLGVTPTSWGSGYPSLCAARQAQGRWLRPVVQLGRQRGGSCRQGGPDLGASGRGVPPGAVGGPAWVWPVVHPRCVSVHLCVVCVFVSVCPGVGVRLDSAMGTWGPAGSRVEVWPWTPTKGRVPQDFSGYQAVAPDPSTVWGRSYVSRTPLRLAWSRSAATHPWGGPVCSLHLPRQKVGGRASLLCERGLAWASSGHCLPGPPPAPSLSLDWTPRLWSKPARDAG